MKNVTVYDLEDVFIVKKESGSNYFVTTEDSIIIPKFNFFALLKFMLFRGLIHPKSLEGLLSEYKE
jgi:hypothetical protein